MAFHQPGGSHGFVPRAPAGGILADTVVDVLRAVDAEADEELVVQEEATPCVVDEDAIGLQPVADALPRYTVFFLQFNDFSEEIDAGKGGLAALPREHGLGKTLLHEAGDHGFEDFVGHKVARHIGIHLAGAQVEAVLTAQIAVRADGFDEELKRSLRSHVQSLAKPGDGVLIHVKKTGLVPLLGDSRVYNSEMAKKGTE